MGCRWGCNSFSGLPGSDRWTVDHVFEEDRDGNANGTGIGKTSGKSDFHHWSGTGHWEGMYTGKSSSCPPFEHLSRVVATNSISLPSV